MKSSKPRLEVLSIAEGATPDPANINKHTQRGRGLHENSMRKRGAGRSIFSAGKGVEVPVVMGGNQTLEIAAQLGMEVVNIHSDGTKIYNIVRDDIAPGSPEFYALAIEDNEVGRLSYNPEIDILAAVMADPAMQALKAEDAMLASIVEGMGLKGETVDAEPQTDRAAELQEKWGTKTGDLWKLGDHRLLIGDCTVRENVERLMGGERADMVFTDPPYGMDLDTDYSTLKSGEGKSIKHEKIIGDDVAFDPKHIFDLFDYCAEILLFGADYYLPRIPNWDAGTWVIWDKRVQENYDKVIGSSFEVLWSKRKRRKEIFRFEYVNWGSRMADGAKLHPTMKPVKLIERIIEPIDANIIVDIYAGSGTTILAAHNLNRRCYAMEISPNYGAVILERYFTATGITPELVTQ